MKISVVTPSFRQSGWLKVCVASVADQEGVEVEHIVQDSLSDDGTGDWLAKDPRVTAVLEKDSGMYDAVNRGYRRATGEILAYLNCDEQYLPGALKTVHDYFAAHPEVDVLVADAIFVDPKGNYLFHRCGEAPAFPSVWVRTNIRTCAMFLRRRVIETHNLFFDTRWRILGDMFWLIEAVRKNLRFGSLRCITSSFTLTGENLSNHANAVEERRLKQELMPKWIKWLKPYIILRHRIETIVNGRTWKNPFDYAIYTKANPKARTTFHAANPNIIWRDPAAAK